MVSLGFFSHFSLVLSVFSVIYCGEFCLNVATNFIGIPSPCPEISCLILVSHREEKSKISSALHILIHKYLFLQLKQGCQHVFNEPVNWISCCSSFRTQYNGRCCGSSQALHRCTTVQFYTLLYVAQPSQYNTLNKPPCRCLLKDSLISRHYQPPTVL